LKPQSFLNPFNSKGESAKDFVWETKIISIQNFAWVGAVKKTKVASNPKQCGDCWENIGNVGDDDQKNNLNEEYERFEFKGGIC